MLDEQTSALNQSQTGQFAQAFVLNMDGLSYEEYFDKVQEMIETLRENWALEQRVKALKVIIQLTKLLADASQMKLYPKKYKLITDSLDEFGRLVYIRVHSLATMTNDGNYRGKPNNTSPNNSKAPPGFSNHIDSREFAKDICRNWFLKVASIRELVPRYYIELAILKTCDILFNSTPRLLVQDPIQEQFFAKSLKRLTRAAWGFGNPVVALHARAYLCKVAERLIDWNGSSSEAILFDLISANLKNSATLINHLDTKLIVDSYQAHSSDICIYFDLISNPIQSILNIVTVRYDVYNDERSFITSTDERLKDLVEILTAEHMSSSTNCCTLKRNIILYSLFKALPNDVVALLAERLMVRLKISYQLWKSANIEATSVKTFNGYNKTLITPTIYSTLASFIIALDGSERFESNPNQELKSSILIFSEELANEMLQCEENRITVHYLRCFKAILSYANHYFDDKIDAILTKFVKQIGRGRQYVNHYATLLDIIKTLFTSKTKIDEFERVFALKSFCRLFDLLRKDEHKLDASKWILESMRAFIKLKGNQVIISDRTSISFLLKLFSTINDALSPLTALDDIRHMSDLVIFFLDIIALDDIYERLEFYSRCRKSVCNLNFVLEYLIRAILKQPDEYRKVEKKKSARQNFLNGCLAFAFSTTPAINDLFDQLELYLEGSRLSLTYMSLSLADYFMKQIINNLVRLTKKQSGLDVAQEVQEDEPNQLRSFGNKSKQENMIIRYVGLLLELVLEHQEHIDLKHKLALANLIKVSFAENSNILQGLKRLNCADDIDDNFNECSQNEFG